MQLKISVHSSITSKDTPECLWGNNHQSGLQRSLRTHPCPPSPEYQPLPSCRRLRLRPYRPNRFKNWPNRKLDSFNIDEQLAWWHHGTHAHRIKQFMSCVFSDQPLGDWWHKKWFLITLVLARGTPRAQRLKLAEERSLPSGYSSPPLVFVPFVKRWIKHDRDCQAFQVLSTQS